MVISGEKNTKKQRPGITVRTGQKLTWKKKMPIVSGTKKNKTTGNQNKKKQAEDSKQCNTALPCRSENLINVSDPTSNTHSNFTPRFSPQRLLPILWPVPSVLPVFSPMLAPISPILSPIHLRCACCGGCARCTTVAAITLCAAGC